MEYKVFESKITEGAHFMREHAADIMVLKFETADEENRQKVLDGLTKYPGNATSPVN